MGKSSGIAATAIIIVIFFGCLAGGYLSVKFFGPDNYVEDGLEAVAENEMEEMVHVPKGALKEEVDAMFPHKKET